MTDRIGIVGAGTMGRNLALNFNNKGIDVVLFEPVEKFYHNAKVHLDSINPDKISLVQEIEEFVKSLDHPMIILILVKAGKPVDSIIQELKPYLDTDDILVDMGNSFFRDTERREKEMNKKGFKYVGCGISGGHEGALTGASIMPGGAFDIKDKLLPMLQLASARLPDNSPCCEWVGKGAAGHFVKMVHNGIEYGIMQLIAETWWILSEVFQLKQERIEEIFTTWNETTLNSYLLEITADIIVEKEHEQYLLDLISEKASHKGTGQWCVEIARDLSVPFNICESALDFRLFSNIEKLTGKSSLTGVSTKPDWTLNWENIIREAYHLGVITAYYQGFQLIHKATITFNMDIDLTTVVRIWQGGCIIRSDILKEFENAESPGIHVKNKLSENHLYLKKMFGLFVNHDLPAPGFSAVFNYLLSLSQRPLPTRLIQAQRDYFGAHGFERIDKESGKLFMKNW